MRRSILFAAGFVLFLIGVGMIRQPSGPFYSVFIQPWQALSGSHRFLNTKLWEVSETAETAGRRLLQPLGVLRLDRMVPVQPDTQSAAH